jgi:hypothetical protein
MKCWTLGSLAVRSTLLFVPLFFVSAFGPCAAEEGAMPFNRAPWLEDLQQMREAFATRYANLEWLVFDREVDIAAVFDEARVRIESASSEAEARGALERVARRVGDGHVELRWPPFPSEAKQSHAQCAELGYDARIQAAGTAALMPGFTPLADDPHRVFPSGTLMQGKHKIGILQIASFFPNAFPQLCEAVAGTVQPDREAPCDEDCEKSINQEVSNRLIRDLEQSLERLKSSGIDVLLVDLSRNGGGTEWSEAAARMVTAKRLQAARMGFVRGPDWAESFAEMEQDIRAAAGKSKGPDRRRLLEFAQSAATLRQQAGTPCDSAPIWKRQRSTCSWLGNDSYYSTGFLTAVAPEELRGKSWGSLVFEPVKFPYKEGVWKGPLIVLVDQGSASASEGFAAQLQDQHAAIIMGAPTFGAGCGHMTGRLPDSLKNSGARLFLPDCARFRADGSNEVLGIQPDVLVGLRTNDGPHRRARYVSEKLREAVDGAIAQAEGANAER